MEERMESSMSVRKWATKNIKNDALVLWGEKQASFLLPPPSEPWVPREIWYLKQKNIEWDYEGPQAENNDWIKQTYHIKESRCS